MKPNDTFSKQSAILEMRISFLKLSIIVRIFSYYILEILKHEKKIKFIVIDVYQIIIVLVKKCILVVHCEGDLGRTNY